VPVLSQILAIVELSLKITLLAMESQSLDQRQRLWQQHIDRMDWWQRLFEKLNPKANE
jgi:hypothetical protein